MATDRLQCDGKAEGAEGDELEAAVRVGGWATRIDLRGLARAAD
jgi:hypothetical protein